jgi:endogenous inhibitor of DNA gyrase (YacG/DUF329 family)
MVGYVSKPLLDVKCPACSYPKARKYGSFASVYECARCGAVHGACYLGESYQIVLPRMVNVDLPFARPKYFDLRTLGSEGLGRRHGWFDPKTRLITRVG